MKTVNHASIAVLLVGAPLAMAHPGDHSHASWLHALASPDHAFLWIVAGALALTLAVRHCRRATARTRRTS